MIPLKLHIKNFLSYGSPTQTISFEPYHLICLSGKNGHGKSSLLDALTWAVWGQARKVSTTTKADEGLLRIGQTQMMVSLDFLCNNHIYRVRREFSLHGTKMATQLDFGILDQVSNQLHSLTDKTIRATQAKIEETIGLSYDTFINSVFIRQGQSNEFSKKSPKERKEILTDLLGLSRFEIIRKQGLEKIRTFQTQANFLKQLITRLENECVTLPMINEQLIKINAELQKCITCEQTLITQLKDNEIRYTQLITQEHEFSLLKTHYAHYCEQQQTLNATLRSSFTQWRTVRRQLRATNQYDAPQQRELIEHELTELTKRYTERVQLKELHIALCATEQKRLNELQELYTQQLQLHQEPCNKQKIVIEHIQAQKNELIEHQTALKQQLRMLSLQLAQIPYLLATRSQFEKLFEKRKNAYHHFITRTNWLTEELKLLQQKKESLNNTSHPSCFTCEQHLSPEHITKLQEHITRQQKIFQHQAARLARIIPLLKQLLLDQHTHKDLFLKNEMLIEQDKEFAQKIFVCSTQLITEQEKAHQCESRYEDFKNNAHKQIITDETLQALRAQKEIIQEKLTLYEQEADKNTSRIATLKEQLNLMSYDTERIKQSALQEQRAHEIFELCKTLKKLKTTLNGLENQIAYITKIEIQKKEICTSISQLTQEKESYIQLKQQLMHQKGALEHHKALLEEKQKEKDACLVNLATIEQTAEDYHIIAQALGKDGIQALLIEHVIPEIEYEANQLLAKLTDNQAHLTIESLRDLKGGGTKETLDIKISDAIGIRPYELFSGGEAFRIDFALRIALSKLLARRAGTSLQTIIIDEGFGSQDEDGLAHIMEALYKIQDDFSKIIIVSHLPAMKDQFPVHFVIAKGPQGSFVRVVEQG